MIISIFKQFSCPGFRNPVFFPVVRFLEKCIFGIYMLWWISECKNFPGQNLSGIRFCPETVIFSHFSRFIIYVHPKQLVTNVFYVTDFSRIPESGFYLSGIQFCPKYIIFRDFFKWLLWISIACSVFRLVKKGSWKLVPNNNQIVFT